MSFDYTIKYKSENTYENTVYQADWQFMVTPEENDTQKIISTNFSSSVDARIEDSINGFNSNTTRVHTKVPFNEIIFEASFKLLKKEVNPFEAIIPSNPTEEFNILNSKEFKIEHEAFLTPTKLTQFSEKHKNIYCFDKSKTIIDNLQHLNNWVYYHLYFKTNVTDVNTPLDEIIEKRHGVCQDFSHLFIAISRQNNIPARYVSGYLHQGDGFFGDSQMHAWIETFLPNIGWVGFDPTNNLLANHNHIKVAHGRDYSDCPPIKGIIYSTGANKTKYAVEVTYQQ